MISSIISRVVILLFGTLYPAYASYKAVKSKNLKDYVKWMMYWIVFALFTCTETFTDIFLSWFPFYYEIKIILVIWLLSPATKGSSILYRKFVHPMLSSKEQEIDDYILKAKEQSYRQVLDLGQKGVTVLMQTAIKSISTQKLVTALTNAQTPTDQPDAVPERNEYRVAESYQTRQVIYTQEYPTLDDFDDNMSEDDVVVAPVVEPKAKPATSKGAKGKRGSKSAGKATKRTTRKTVKTDEAESSDF